MTRAIAIISCLIAALFLVPIQGECCESPEYESESKIECCVAADSLFQSQIAEELPRLLPSSNLVRRHVLISVKMLKHVLHIPTRILNCVFRE
jgi:hypothetical protein